MATSGGGANKGREREIDGLLGFGGSQTMAGEEGQRNPQVMEWPTMSL